MNHEGFDEISFCSAYLFMRHVALKRKALDNPPPDGLLVLGAYMPRSLFGIIDSGIERYLKDETDELPYASEKCSLENPLGLLTVSPKAHKKSTGAQASFRLTSLAGLLSLPCKKEAFTGLMIRETLIFSNCIDKWV